MFLCTSKVLLLATLFAFRRKLRLFVNKYKKKLRSMFFTPLYGSVFIVFLTFSIYNNPFLASVLLSFF